MTVEVKLFAIARQMAGRETVFVDLPAGATVAELRQALGEAVPELGPLLGAMSFAVDGDYAPETTTISPQAELACIPPVSGG